MSDVTMSDPQTNTIFRHPTESDIPMHGWRPYSEFHRERVRAHAKHSPNGGSMEQKDWDHPIWLAVVTEEVGEVARVLCDMALGLDKGIEDLREELVQVGAMVAAWVDAIDAPFRAAFEREDSDE